ncbi:hypothetical protein MSAN_02215000 [Mycena sanguinolenta]|uniref:Uncharacterized protein n=1 Tax=Mycena sanguinolenta TaxID=230812 RepID=A0A8H6XE77_9AGAR|nr:hypothetical protein MSAN_02215000 [Mycena sanguinolenta]
MTEDLHNKAVALHELAINPLAASVRQWHFMGDHELDHGDIHQRLPLIANIHILQDTWRQVSTIFTATLHLSAFDHSPPLQVAHRLYRRFVRNRPVERVELDGSGTEIAAETVLSTLSAVSEGSVSLRTLSIAPASPVEASPGIFQTVGSCFPDLCSLKLEFIDQDRELSSVADSDEDPEEGGVASDAEDTIDTRIVVLPEGTSVPRAADEESAPVFPDKRKLRQESLPENLLPGYLYNHGGVYPPNPDRLEPDDESLPLATVMDFIRDGRIVLSPHLEVLNFMRQPPWVGKSEFDTDEQHQAILSLETFVPTLREIGFCDSQDRWLRDHHVWIRDPSAPGRINWGRPGPRIVSRVWNEDGTKRKECTVNE